MKNTFFFALILALSLFISSCESSAPDGVTESRWQVHQVIDNGTVLDNKGSYILEFEQSSFRIQLDINSCGGEVCFQAGRKIHMGPAYCTEACCDSEFALLVLNILEKSEAYDHNDDILSITDKKRTVVFKRV